MQSILKAKGVDSSSELTRRALLKSAAGLKHALFDKSVAGEAAEAEKTETASCTIELRDGDDNLVDLEVEMSAAEWVATLNGVWSSAETTLRVRAYPDCWLGWLSE